MRLTITVEVPDVVGEVLKAALAESTNVLICPETIYPGYIGKIVKEPDE